MNSNGNIIIVDNASPNNSGKELKTYFDNDSRVEVIFQDKNEGFAKGNNYGYSYVKEKYGANYIVVMNNDVFIEQIDFEDVIKKFMITNNVDVCGPDIITNSGGHQNPLWLDSITNKTLTKNIVHGIVKCIFLRFDHLYKLYIDRQRKNEYNYPDFIKSDIFDCILHGSCIIYGPNYIKNENIAFLPITFMYNEEAILFDYLKHKSYKTGVCAGAEVYHMQGQSTQHDRIKDQFMFRLKNSTYSDFKQLQLRRHRFDYTYISHIKIF